MRTGLLRRPIVVVALAAALAGVSAGCAMTSNVTSPAGASGSTAVAGRPLATPTAPAASTGVDSSRLARSYDRDGDAYPAKASFCRGLHLDDLLLTTFGSVEFSGSKPPVTQPDAAACTYRGFTPRHSFIIGVAVMRASPGYGPSAVCGPGGSSSAATTITRSFELGDMACQQRARSGFRSYTVAVDRGISASVSLVDGYGVQDRSLDRATRSAMRRLVEVVLDQRPELNAALPGGD